MNKKDVLIFGGTEEGRIISEKISNLGISTTVSVATSYGVKLLKENENLFIKQGRMNENEILDFIIKNNFAVVLDCTHPYAVEASRNIKQACNKLDIKYIRVLREKSLRLKATFFDNIESLISYFNNNEGNIFLTTGTKDLKKFTSINEYKKRLFVRILPNIESLEKCEDAEISPRNIICMQGPFSKELNKEMFKYADAKYIVSKDSGKSGGVCEKEKAAAEIGAEFIIIKGIEETGVNINEALKEVLKYA